MSMILRRIILLLEKVLLRCKWNASTAFSLERIKSHSGEKCKKFTYFSTSTYDVSFNTVFNTVCNAGPLTLWLEDRGCSSPPVEASMWEKPTQAKPEIPNENIQTKTIRQRSQSKSCGTKTGPRCSWFPSMDLSSRLSLSLPTHPQMRLKL